MTTIEVPPVLLYQDAAELVQLVYLYEHKRPLRVLEIGSAYGGTLYFWLTRAQPGAIVVSVDLQSDAMAREGADPNLWRSWKRPDVVLHLIKGDSKDARIIEQVQALAPFDFIFIDGDHSYEGVEHDWRTYRPMAARGALIAFDDIKPNDVATDPPCEVSRLWAQIHAGPLFTQEIINSPTSLGNGLGIVWMPQ